VAAVVVELPVTGAVKALSGLVDPVLGVAEPVLIEFIEPAEAIDAVEVGSLVSLWLAGLVGSGTLDDIAGGF
jgi:hypothetical protein